MKLHYAGPFFRYERPQAGRYRQLQQVGVEAIGVDDPALDAEVIAVADEGFRALGLTGYRLELTSLGDADCRPAYGALLREFLAGLDLDEATRRRAQLNPLRVLDDKRPEVRALLADAPLLVDHLSPAAAAHHAAGASSTSTTWAWPTSRTRGWCAGSTTTRRRRSSSSTTGSARSPGSAAAGATTG